MLENVVVPIVIVFIIIGLPILCGTLIKLAHIMKSDGRSASKGHSSSSRDEAQIMQEIHQTLMRLEKRIDALETIVIENPTRKP